MNNSNVFEGLNKYIINNCNTLGDIEKNIPFIDEKCISYIKSKNIANIPSSTAIASGIFAGSTAGMIAGLMGKAINKCGNILHDINKENSNIQYDIEDWIEIVNNNTIDEIISKIKFNNFSIHHYLNHLKNYKKMTFGEIVEKSNIRESYLKPVFNIKNNKARRKPNRDCIIGLSFAFRLNILETNYLLQAAGYNPLYLRNKRDMIIYKCITNKFDVSELNSYLIKFTCDKIGNWDEDEGIY